jgi:Cys-tRNA(Pro) deacylase
VKKENLPVTQAIRVLRESKVPFIQRSYKYQERQIALGAARELRLNEHWVVKTLVMKDDRDHPLVVLMHGDKEVSTKALARAIGAKSVTPCTPGEAQRNSGYLVGGISPFGMRQSFPVYVETTIMDLPKIYVNAGKRGFLVEISPVDLSRLLKPTPVTVAR